MKQQDGRTTSLGEAITMWNQDEGRYGWAERKQVYQIRIPDARYWLEQGLKNYCGEDAVLTLSEDGRDAYQEVAEWMTDNKRRGLLLYGKCGLGKTVICTMILPRLIRHFCNLIIVGCKARELKQHYEELLKRKKALIVIDDVGVEYEAKEYGEELGLLFSLIVDDAEEKGNLLLLTTNLTLGELRDKYGDRTFDRLKALTKTVLFDGESFRGKT